MLLAALLCLSSCEAIVRPVHDTTAREAQTVSVFETEPEATVPSEVTKPESLPESEAQTLPETTAETEPYSRYNTYPTTLMYHCVHDEPYTQNTALFVRPYDLEEHCKALVELDIDTLFADEFGPVDKKSVILTFDDGYEDNYTYMFPIIKRYNIKVTVYMIAYKIDKPGYLTRDQIKEMSDSGLVQFGSHTLDHTSLTQLSEQQMKEQMEGANWMISEITGKEVTTIAYPSGDYNEIAISVARTIYKFAYTTNAQSYYGQDDMLLPRYAILRGAGREQFLVYLQ